MSFDYFMISYTISINQWIRTHLIYLILIGAWKNWGISWGQVAGKFRAELQKEDEDGRSFDAGLEIHQRSKGAKHHRISSSNPIFSILF